MYLKIEKVKIKELNETRENLVCCECGKRNFTSQGTEQSKKLLLICKACKTIHVVAIKIGKRPKE